MDQQAVFLNFVGILEQSSLRRTRSAGSILVISAAMTRAHEQIRLLEPADRATEVRTINGKHLELLPVNIAHPARDVCGLSIPGIHHRVAVRGQAGLAGRKLIQWPKSEPRVISPG